MRFKGNYLRFFPLFLLAGLIFLSGCATTTTQNLFTISGTGWHIQQGQALWTPFRGAPQFGGDIVFATDDSGRFFVEFDKTPLTIVVAQATPEHWLIRFPQMGQIWIGHQPAPTRTVWLYLADALAGKPLPPALHFEHKPDGGWRLQSEKSGESLEGFLSP